MANCTHCGADLVYKAAYTKDDGTVMGASWRCPNWKPQGKGCPGTFIKAGNGQPPPQQQRQPAPQAAPVAARAPIQSPNYTDRSIAAQACCKAACEAAAGAIGPMALNMSQAEVWTVTLARKLYNNVVAPAMGAAPLNGQGGPDDDLNF